MASTVSLEGIKQAVFFPFQGKKWGIKVLIGAVLLFIGGFFIPLLPIYGYYGRIMKRIIVQDEDPGMPEWDDWGGLFLDGIKLFGAALIYLLPSLLLISVGYILFMVLDLSFAFATPSYTQSPSGFFPTAVIGSTLGIFAGMGMILVGVVLAVITSFIIPLALANLIVKGEFSAAFRVKEWWSILKANFSGYILANALVFGIFYLMYMLAFAFYATVILCFILPFALAFTFFISGVIGFGIYSIAYRDGIRQLATTAVM
jgi:hypothetical protein